jgi:hypothetical protein
MRSEKGPFPTLPEGTRARDSLPRAYLFHFPAKFNVALLEVQNLLSGQLLAGVRFSLRLGTAPPAFATQQKQCSKHRNY